MFTLLVTYSIFLGTLFIKEKQEKAEILKWPFCCQVTALDGCLLIKIMSVFLSAARLVNDIRLKFIGILMSN